MASQDGDHRTRFLFYSGLYKERQSGTRIPDIWTWSDWRFVGKWGSPPGVPQSHREAGIVSVSRKHTSVSWMKLFWFKPGQTDRLEKRKLIPVIHTRPFSPSLLLLFASSLPPTHFKSSLSIKILLILQGPAHLLPFLWYLWFLLSEWLSPSSMFISTVHLCGFFLAIVSRVYFCFGDRFLVQLCPSQ